MNLSQLTVFREVMKTGSMSEAANNLGRTQPAISLALKSLEDSLDITLFDRNTRNLKPVPEAYYLLSEADSVLVQLAQLKRTMSRLKAGNEGELHLAAMPGVATLLFPEFLSQFTNNQSEINLTLHTRSSTQLRELVSSQGVDLGFGDYETDRSRTMQTNETVISGDSFIALPASNPATQKERVSLSEMTGHTFGMMHLEHAFQRSCEEALDRANANIKVQFRSQTVLPLLQFVASGQCCAIVDPLTVASARLLKMSSDQIVFKPLTDPIRYHYAVLVPNMRPRSVLSNKIAEAWTDYVINKLNDLKASPETTVIS